MRYVDFLAIGKILMYFIRKFPLSQKIADLNPYLDELLHCDLCLGWWVYTVSSFLTGTNIVKSKRKWFGNVITGSVSSFLSFVFTVGWRELFQIYKVD